MDLQSKDAHVLSVQNMRTTFVKESWSGCAATNACQTGVARQLRASVVSLFVELSLDCAESRRQCVASFRSEVQPR